VSKSVRVYPGRDGTFPPTALREGFHQNCPRPPSVNPCPLHEYEWAGAAGRSPR
jgi:hypothetical protein